MAKIGPIDFKDHIIDALRDEKLVIFAGAGVSMGYPSNLASFVELAQKIAEGTGFDAVAPYDRFLGMLHHKGVKVHERAVHSLSPANSLPNELHRDLLRVFRSFERIRIVTTNFDNHFESAANSLFGILPDIYRAPALPLGRDFNGIVHVHGSMNRPSGMVLTDADFGRAYLTEGWARRFLVEVFRNYTVLFIGYSYDDVVMNYLTRALPVNNDAGRRFALTDKDAEKWDLLGINPIVFKIGTGDEAFKELYEGVYLLAKYVNRGVLDWKTRLAEIANRLPPEDQDDIEDVAQALREISTTRFLLNVARDPEWPRWLDTHKYLDALFGVNELSERDKILSSWLAHNFVNEYPNIVFELLASHGMRMNPILWWSIGRELGSNDNGDLDDSSLKRWITIMLASEVGQKDHHVLMRIAERCADRKQIQLTLMIFHAMCEHNLIIKRGFVWGDKENNETGINIEVECVPCANQWSLNVLWTKYLKPNISLIAKPLLSGIIQHFEKIYQELEAWDKASQDWDTVCLHRSAIEQHEQDCYPEVVDVLIDAARDTLEWFASNSIEQLDAWIEQLLASKAPILRRLAIHAISVHSEKTSDERLNWLMYHIGLYNIPDYHEVHRVVGLNYPVASEAVRIAVISAVCARKEKSFGDSSAENETARAHFEWLSWILQAEPNCPLAKAAMEPIQAEYPNLEPSDHPDFTHWQGAMHYIGDQSPWSVDQLLAKEPCDQLDDLLTFTGSRFNGPDRNGLKTSIKDACKQQPSWSFKLADVLAEKLLCSSDLWHPIFQGWQETDLSLNDWHAVLNISAIQELHPEFANDIANLLNSVVQNGGKPFALDLLEHANIVAWILWQNLKPYEKDEDIDDWLTLAINYPAGVLVEFWINSLSLLMHDKNGKEIYLPENYKEWFTQILQDPSINGGMGRCYLARKISFMLRLDEAWTLTNVAPLFSHKNHFMFNPAWDGFLFARRLDPLLSSVLYPAFLAAVPCLYTNNPNRRRKFIDYYAVMAVYFVDDPMHQLLPELFKNGSVDDWIEFDSHIGRLLHEMQPETKQQLWNRWLSRYWEARLQAVPARLNETEIRKMLDWLPDLGDLYPLAVSIAIRSPEIRLEGSTLLIMLNESDLIKRYPEETANLLIYICNCEVGYSLDDLITVEKCLPELPQNLRHRLDEGLARIGAK